MRAPTRARRGGGGGGGGGVDRAVVLGSVLLLWCGRVRVKVRVRVRV